MTNLSYSTIEHKFRRITKRINQNTDLLQNAHDLTAQDVSREKCDLNPSYLIFRASNLPTDCQSRWQRQSLIEMESENKKVVNKR